MLLASAIVWLGAAIHELPNRAELGLRTLPLHYEAVGLPARQIGPFMVVGAWQLHANDVRLGGFSALAVDRHGFLALSDWGVVARLGRPGARQPLITLDEVPDGPGDPAFKFNRDSEALAADPGGRGWWVAFENRNALWLYDRQFRGVIERRSVPAPGFSRNRGVEGMVAGDADLLLFPEKGRQAVRATAGAVPIVGLGGWISDAVRLSATRLLIANRTPAAFGLSNRLVLMEVRPDGLKALASWRIPLERLDNVEALAIEPRPDGAVRLWMMTDNSRQQRRPTLLIALELRPRPAR